MPSPLSQVSRSLSRTVSSLAFSPPVAYVYNPLDYARATHEAYLDRWGAAPREIVLLGMNPGPFGMAQTGVPFGDPEMVRSWLGIDGPVKRPSREHPKRPVLGFAQERGEVSGARLWGWARDRFGTPERFFAEFFVANWCPLAFLDAAGRNLTPDKLPSSEREALREPCDRALRETVAALSPRLVVGVGAFAEKRAREALAGLPVAVGGMLHPSPASPAANRGWAAQAERALRALGIRLP
ncbi:MAG: single-stranded DNA-binding protein [Deltaproteobacteria bacterium]|nr:single-stranded DNA-binding protein [Deltaproteobacteria bacterium]